MITKTREEQLSFLKNMKDEDIDFSDIPEIDGSEVWRPNSVFYKPVKSKFNVTLDNDVISWLRKNKGKASHLINELVKKEMLRHA